MAIQLSVPYRLTQVHQPPETKVHIIAIHGLGTSSATTWNAWENERGDTTDRGRSVNWLRDDDMLPSMIPDASIWTYDWNANFLDNAPDHTLHSQADLLLACLHSHPLLDHEKHPIIVVASCYGGLLAAQAVDNAAFEGSLYRHLLERLAGIVFLATPLRGTQSNFVADWAVYVAGIMRKSPSDKLIKDLDDSTEVLKELTRRFARIATIPHLAFSVHCFFETQTTNVLRRWFSRGMADVFSTKGTDRILVERDAASLDHVPRHGLNANHAMMNKYRGPDDPSYQVVSTVLRRMAEDASRILTSRGESGTQSLPGKYVSDHSHSAGSTPSQANECWSVPRATNPTFVGREDILSRISDSLFDSSKVKAGRFVVTGIGGQGKSELCLELASRLRQRYWGVFWVDVSDTSAAEKTLRDIVARFLGRSVGTLQAAVQELSNTKETWLLVLDNADDPNVDYSIYFPSGIAGSVLMTSRPQESHEYANLGHEALQGLSADESAELLFKVVQLADEQRVGSPEARHDVAELLGHHPLALIQAASYVSRGYCKMEEYPRLFRLQASPSERLRINRARLLKRDLDVMQPRYKNVFTTFEVSVEGLQDSEELAAKDALDLLGVLAALHFSFWPLDAFKLTQEECQSLADQAPKPDAWFMRPSRWNVDRVPSCLRVDDYPRVLDAVNLLKSLALVDGSTQEGYYGVSMHPVTHAWAMLRLSRSEQKQSWISAGLSMSLSVDSSSDVWARWADSLTPHLRAYFGSEGQNILFESRRDRDIEELTSSFIVLIGWLASTGRDRLMSWALKIIFECLQLNPSEPKKGFLALYYWQGCAMSRENKFQQACDILRRIIDLSPLHHSGRLACQGRLARTYEMNNQTVEAKNIYKEMVETERTRADNIMIRLEGPHVLAQAYLQMGQTDKAVNLLECEFEIAECLRTFMSSSYLSCAYQLASVYRAIRRLDKSTDLLRRVIRNTESSLSENDPARLLCKLMLAKNYIAQGQAQEAVNLLENDVSNREHPLQDGSALSLRAECYLAAAYRYSGRIQEAIDLLELATKTGKAFLREGHRDLEAACGLLEDYRSITEDTANNIEQG